MIGTVDLAARLDVPELMLQRWVWRGFVDPTRAGPHYLWTWAQARQASAARELVCVGFEPETLAVRTAFDALRSRVLHLEAAGWLLVITAGRPAFHDPTQRLPLCRGVTTIIDLGRVWRRRGLYPGEEAAA